jgi:hypothetical protein
MTTQEIAIAFHKWLLEEDTFERAEKWFHFSDEDMFKAFLEENPEYKTTDPIIWMPTRSEMIKEANQRHPGGSVALALKHAGFVDCFDWINNQRSKL